MGTRIPVAKYNNTLYSATIATIYFNLEKQDILSFFTNVMINVVLCISYSTDKSKLFFLRIVKLSEFTIGS